MAFNTALKLAGLVVVLIVIIALMSSVWPTNEDEFIEFGLLGKNKTADAYFPNANAELGVGAQSNWYIYVHNHMGSAQKVSVRIKLLNSTMQLSNERENEPSSYSSFFEWSSSLYANETALLPFVWSIAKATRQNNSVAIENLIVNGQEVKVDVESIFPYTFYVTFELWTFDSSLGEYKFGWESEKGLSFATLNMGFDVVLP